jgi:hypothetical protein
MAARKQSIITQAPEISESFVQGANAGYAVRTTVLSTTETIRESAKNTKERVGGFILGMFGPSKPKEKKEVKVNVPKPVLEQWLKAKQGS